MRPIGPRLQAGHEEEIDYLDNIGLDGNPDGPTSRSKRQELRMIDATRAAVRQVDLEGLERLRPVHLAELIDSHTRIIRGKNPRSNEANLTRDTRSRWSSRTQRHRRRLLQCQRHTECACY